MTFGNKPIANPLVVLREEFDDWAILFDPDTGEAYGLNPLSVFIWKRLDGRHTIDDILKEIRRECPDAPAEAAQDLKAFIEAVVNNGLAGFEHSVE